MNYTTEMGPKLTQWAIDKIKRDYPDDVALLIGVEHKSTDGSGHGECFDCYVSATGRGGELGREIKIGGVNHDLFDCGWERLERMANLRDGAAFLVIDGEILYSRSPGDAARFEALRQLQKGNLADRQFVYRRALELLDDAMNLYRNMMFEERPHQVRLAAGYVFHYLLTAVLFLNGTYWMAHWHGQLAQLARCGEKPEQFEAYYKALLGAKTTGELKSIAHLVIQSARKFIAARRPAATKDEFSTDYQFLAEVYSEMSLTWRRLRISCERGDIDAAFADACWLQNVMHNEICGEYGLPDMDILGAFDSGNLMALSEQASEVERRVGAWIEARHPLVEEYATFEEFAEKNP
jgi:hypothetical protein